MTSDPGPSSAVEGLAEAETTASNLREAIAYAVELAEGGHAEVQAELDEGGAPDGR